MEMERDDHIEEPDPLSEMGEWGHCIVYQSKLAPLHCVPALRAGRSPLREEARKCLGRVEILK